VRTLLSSVFRLSATLCTSSAGSAANSWSCDSPCSQRSASATAARGASRVSVCAPARAACTRQAPPPRRCARRQRCQSRPRRAARLPRSQPPSVPSCGPGSLPNRTPRRRTSEACNTACASETRQEGGLLGVGHSSNAATLHAAVSTTEPASRALGRIYMCMYTRLTGSHVPRVSHTVVLCQQRHQLQHAGAAAAFFGVVCDQRPPRGASVACTVITSSAEALAARPRGRPFRPAGAPYTPSSTSAATAAVSIGCTAQLALRLSLRRWHE
jgi:hypothetical protein